jgi:dihydroflavonol-4-reductase
MRVAVTGATGFLGTHLLTVLADHEVVPLSRRPNAAGVSADVTDADALRGVFDGCDAVIHAAGRVDHSEEGAALTWAVHVNGTQNVIAECRRAGVPRLVHVSSSGTVAVTATPKSVSEDSSAPTHIISGWPYYRSKLHAEQLALAANDDQLAVVSVNPSLLLGPGDPDGGATDTVRRFLRGQVPFSPTGGLSFADVRDVAKTTARLLTEGEPGERYLLGAANWSFTDFYGRLARLTGKRAPLPTPAVANRILSWLPNLGKGGFTPRLPLTRMDVELTRYWWWLDDHKATHSLDWSPRDPLTTLSDTVFDLRQRGLA